ncbi:MAG: LLM class flavin-dependent oxidoreductase [Alphaproteobacteria bacterium]|nr:LLM class flavin-dependent oxidoreductase [Alphaproteobacteria bacterium]
MRFNFFHLMPYDVFPERVEQWPVDNSEFDAELARRLYQEYMDTMVYAEECGWDSIGCNEHHFSPYGLMSNCNLIGSALIQRTSRVKIAMFGNLVPLLNPIRVAEEYAMLDVISGGRLMTGFMRGIPHEYLAYGIAPDESRPRLAEATQLIRKAWTEPAPFGWEGEYYKFRAVSLWPKPMQKPHPPIMYSGSNPDSARVAARNGMMLGMVFIPNLEAGRSVIDAYIDEARICGWEPGPEHILCGFHTCIAESDEAARENLARGVKYFMSILMSPQREAQQIVVQKSRYFGTDGSGEYFLQRLNHAGTRTIEGAIEDGTVICGTPETAVKQIKRIHAELGCGWINTNMKIGNIPNDVVRRGMELFRDHVHAEVRDLAKTPDTMPVMAMVGE